MNFAQRVTFRELAAKAGQSPRAIKRRLRKLYDREGGDWWIREGDRPGHPNPPRAPVRIDLDRLQKAHPEICAPRGPVSDMGDKVRSLEKRLNAVSAAVRQLRAVVMGRSSPVPLSGDHG